MHKVFKYFGSKNILKSCKKGFHYFSASHTHENRLSRVILQLEGQEGYIILIQNFIRIGVNFEKYKNIL